MKDSQTRYINVVLPLAIGGAYTYALAEHMVDRIQFGMRVEVPLRNKAYAGLVVDTDAQPSTTHKAKYVRDIIDNTPIITEKQYKLWQWMASYYCCSIGEVMLVALPSGLKLSSETKLVIHPDFDQNFEDLSDEEFLIAEAISIQEELSVEQAKDIIQKKSIYPYIRNLLDRQVLFIKEELLQKYKAKKIVTIRLHDQYASNDAAFESALALTSRSEKQSHALMTYRDISSPHVDLPRSTLMEESGVSHAVIKALVNKEIFVLEEKTISRIHTGDEISDALPPLNPLQVEAYEHIKSEWETHTTCLLHGITGSGKTRVYMELMKDMLTAGKQVLYMLPEIALTSQIVHRLEAAFGDQIIVYHSRLNPHERVEVWLAAQKDAKIIVGARSSILLPFHNVGLIVVDEEHDPSYKQQDPSPRYNARDTASVAAHYYDAKVLLGSATPSLETMSNARSGKYGMAQMFQRHSQVALPLIEVVDLKYAYKTGRMKSHFSLQLRKHIEQALADKEQVLIFQNRRGYTPTLSCEVCGWSAQCAHCDVGLTYHKYHHQLKCHYCGYRARKPNACPDCGHNQLNESGIGTEKIEDIIRELFPSAKVHRMDYDTTRSKSAYENILYDFGRGEIDILVGTQMITKGLDFDHIAVVGILQADRLLYMPDFRASERAFQLMTQVAGRSGRREKQGKVVIQTYQPDHPIIHETVRGAYGDFYQREMQERIMTRYAPVQRMISILLKHKKPQTVQDAASTMAEILKPKLGPSIIGPAQPGIARIRGMYLQQMLIKLDRSPKNLQVAKSWILESKNAIQKMAGFRSVRINIDVDPY